MKKLFLILQYLLLIMSVQLHAQTYVTYSFDTIQIEQQWKKHLTGGKDTSYIRVCMPSKDVKPVYNIDNYGFTIICNDGAIIRFNTMPIIPSTIESDVTDEFSEDTISKYFGGNIIDVLQREYFNTHVWDKPQDSSMYHPQRIVLEGVNKDGLYWKVVRLEYVCVSYENVTTDRLPMYDFIINEFRVLKEDEVKYYRPLPLGLDLKKDDLLIKQSPLDSK